jgi:hypothetical protein
MSDYELNHLELIDEKKEQFRQRRKRKDEPEEVIIKIKEFDLNSMPPHSISDTKNGIKIVVIGKPGCFAKGTEVLMFDGSFKNIENVIIGDIVMGDDNTSREVLELYHDTDDMYEIQNNCKNSYTVNRLHDLVLSTQNGHILEISVEDYLKKDFNSKRKLHAFSSHEINCWEDTLTSQHTNPFFLGLLIGTNNIFFGPDNINIINPFAFTIAMDIFPNPVNIEYLRGFNYSFIPQIYKINSVQTRKNILAGIIDILGVSHDAGYTIDLPESTKLTDDIIFISKSLGFKTTISKIKLFKHALTPYLRITIIGSLPTLLLPPPTKKSYHTDHPFRVIYKGKNEYFGFKLNKNRRFLLANLEVVKNTGKSTIIQDICASKAHIIATAQIFSGTEDSNHYYSTKFPPCCIFGKLDLGAVENFITRQKVAKEWLPNPWALQLIDDCTDDPSILKKPVFQAIYKNGRHWNMVHILSLQYCMDILPSIRTNIDYTFILRETNQRNRKALWENYAGCIPSLQMFQDIMDSITEDFTALVINNRIQSNKLEDCIFWYKAHPERLSENIQFCHPTAWEFNEERFDPNAIISMI